MDLYRFLGAGLFFYECLRLLLLVVFMFLGNPVNGGFFPYLVYLSSNALFPLMVLFVWLRPAEYRNYLSLYITGKIVALVSFYAWQFFSFREFPGEENVVLSVVLFWGSVSVSLADILSLWGAWVLKNKSRQMPADSANPPESGGV